MRLRLLFAGLTVVSSLSAPAFAAGTKVPASAQGVWAEAGKCSGTTVTFTAGTLQYKGQKAQAVFFAPKESPRGYGAIHYKQEGNVDNFEYADDKDQMLYNPEGFGMGKSVLYKRCAGAAASSGSATAGQAENRCGWLANPTPGNWWLVDKDKTWVLASQGDAEGAGSAGMDKLPEFDPKQYVNSNGNYGYGCACLKLVTDPATKTVKSIAGGKILPLATCKKDKSLPPESKL
ncbi:DUF4087 domain-containing protein [Mesorhizobium sp. 1M-11]|uniref:DUF4087 domain-containing protein n=1 Tax=Mesorhizobium sp. 1M-11 TaxID=1529006 RepID=UPI000A912F2C|nr:DUF4087 domain-containing protein [Mesorhizobium sp. 1M-11]